MKKLKPLSRHILCYCTLTSVNRGNSQPIKPLHSLREAVWKSIKDPEDQPAPFVNYWRNLQHRFKTRFRNTQSPFWKLHTSQNVNFLICTGSQFPSSQSVKSVTGAPVVQTTYWFPHADVTIA